MRTALWILVPLVGVAVLGGLALRSGKLARGGSVEDEMRRFRQGLDALDPANDPLRRRQLAEESARALNSNPEH